MIGMMNTQLDDPAQFYAQRRIKKIRDVHHGDPVGPFSAETFSDEEDMDMLEPSLYELPTLKKISYCADGRRMVNGELEVRESPENMWNNSVLRVTCFTTLHVPVKKGLIARQKSRLSKLIDHSRTSISRAFRFGGKVEAEKVGEEVKENQKDDANKRSKPIIEEVELERAAELADKFADLQPRRRMAQKKIGRWP